MGDDRSSAYASAELGTELRGGASDTVRSFAGLIDDPETIRLLNYYDDILPGPVEETAIGRTIIANASTLTVDSAVRGGNVSQMKAATGLTNQEREGGDLLTEASKQLAFEGAIGLVFGAPGSGKTATTLDVAMTWRARTGGAVIGNTSWDGFDAVVKSDTEMLETMASIEGPVLAVLDEIAQELSGFGTGNKAAESFSDSLLFIRKKTDHGRFPKQGSVLMVGHTRTKTAKCIRRVSSFAVEKPNRSDPSKARLLESEGGQDTWDEIGDFTGLTDTAADYPEHEPSEFVILEGDDDDQDGDTDVDGLKRMEAITTVVKAVEEQGMKYEDAGALVGYSRTWVNNRMAEYRRGEFPELVNEIDV